MVIEATTAISLMAATTEYAPCTKYRTDICTDAPQWPTLYIPCPPNTYCPPNDIPHSAKKQRELEQEKWINQPE